MGTMKNEELEHIKYVWEGISTGVARTHHYKTLMITFYNEKNNTGYKPTTNCGSCLGSIYTWWKKLAEENGLVKKPKAKKSVRKNT
tara:strand:+ start:172 stop:429 length:258 start_codon:yes stop_codon:yes gene_type:complete